MNFNFHFARHYQRNRAFGEVQQDIITCLFLSGNLGQGPKAENNKWKVLSWLKIDRPFINEVAKNSSIKEEFNQQ